MRKLLFQGVCSNKLTHKFFRYTGLLVLTFGLVSCASTPPYNPFQTSKDQFRSQVKRIVLIPVAIPPQLGVSKDAKHNFDILIEKNLDDAGFTTFPASNWGVVFERNKQKAGGLFDPKTGKLDENKVHIIWTKTAEEIRTQFKFDAILVPRIHVVKANWQSAWANWDGTSEALATGLGVFGAPNAYGTLPALSLYVSIGSSNPDGPALYRQHAGIQVLKKLTPLTERFSGDLFTPIPKEEILTNDERNRTAVEIAFGPLMARKKEEK